MNSSSPTFKTFSPSTTRTILYTLQYRRVQVRIQSSMCAFSMNSNIHSNRLRNSFSVSPARLIANLLCLEYILHLTPPSMVSMSLCLTPSAHCIQFQAPIPLNVTYQVSMNRNFLFKFMMSLYPSLLL